MACQWRVTPVGAIWLCCLGNTDAGFLTPPVSQLSAIHIAASLARAKFVVSDGRSAPVVTDGPFPESKELLAGYRMIDVETLDRAIEIAAQASAAPGPNGEPIRQAIEVREVMGAPDPEV